MRRSFEELIGPELDRLYRAAFLLSGGLSRRAEALIQSAAVTAFRDYEDLERPVEQPGRWLDGHLAACFLRKAERLDHAAVADAQPARNAQASPRSAAGSRTGPTPPESFRSLELEDVARAALILPPGHRVAFWLAVVERRRYGDICRILGEPRDTVSRWIGEAHRLMIRSLSGSASIPQAKGD
jgi:DNA-directed RNA polymerase specialized sigma24 family protein